MRIDEFRRDVVVGQIAGEHRMNDADREILMYLEMKMGRIKSMGVTNGADLLPTSHLLTFSYENPVEMTVEGVRLLHLPFLHKGMANDDHVSPGSTKIPGQSYYPGANRINRITEICPASSLPDPV